MADRLYTLWLDVYNAACDNDIPAFKRTLSTFTSWYKKASDAEQGEYHYKVAQFMKG